MISDISQARLHGASPETDHGNRSVDAVFPGGGELGALCRAHDWSATPLGPVETWPQSLRSTVSVVLSCDFPMIVLWGQGLIQIYNDAYRVIMGAKHPQGLGQGTRDCWPEVWHINEKIYPRIMAGETVSFREALYPLAPNGTLEDHYLTICYNPVRDETGGVGGVLVTLFNVTGEVRLRAERDRALAEAKAERARLYEVFMQAPAIIAVVEGPDYLFTAANALYRELTGGGDPVGKTVREALPEIEGQGFIALLDGVRRTGEPYVAREALVRLDRDGDGVTEDIYVDFVYQPLKNADGSVFGIVAHAVDTTMQVLARREAEQRSAALALLSDALAESNRDLDQFAYVASHDLKAPLRGISNLAEWVEDDLGDRLTDSARENLGLLRGRVHRMEALIDGILNYSRASRARTQPEDLDAGALVRDAIDLLAPPPAVHFEIAPHMPTLRAERVPLQQVFLNLLGNAIKYAHAYRPDARIEVSWRDVGETYEFSIRDNGPGIESKYHDRIWDIFQTLESRDKVEGTGIGLSVVKKTVEARGGRVGLTSAVGEGATFQFTWPKQPKLPAAPHAA